MHSTVSSAANRLLRLMRIVRVRLVPWEAYMTGKKWISRWKNMIAATKIPGIWERKEGGHLVRARIVDPTTGHLREIKRVLPDATKAMALKWLEDERARIRAGLASAEPQKTRFAEFAASLFEQKVNVGDIRSAKGREKWSCTLEHLIGGTTGSQSGKHADGFGDMFIDKIHVSHVEAWKQAVSGLLRAGDYKPTTGTCQRV